MVDAPSEGKQDGIRWSNLIQILHYCLLDNVEAVLEAVHVVSGQRPGVDGFNQPDDASLL